MRFMMIVKATRESELGLPPRPELMAAVSRATFAAAAAGIMVDGGGLLPSSLGARVRLAEGHVVVQRGPFGEPRELMSGWAILELPSLEAAIEHGRRFMDLHRDVLGPDCEGEVEIRPLLQESDLARAG